MTLVSMPAKCVIQGYFFTLKYSNMAVLLTIQQNRAINNPLTGYSQLFVYNPKVLLHDLRKPPCRH